MGTSYRGQFLIAARHLRDPNFYKTVLLIVEHGDHGAMGLVINRPSSILVRNALAGQFDLPDSDDLIYVGGPVEPAALFILHDVVELNDDEEPVLKGLYVGTNAEAFEEVVRRASLQDENLKFCIYSGCAGWAPGQLEGEIARGDWLVRPACHDAVFHEDPYSVYDLLMQKVYEQHRLLPTTCPDPSRN